MKKFLVIVALFLCLPANAQMSTLKPLTPTITTITKPNNAVNTLPCYPPVIKLQPQIIQPVKTQSQSIQPINAGYR